MTIDRNPQRILGKQRRLDVLYFLARAGYATTRQLAYYCTGSTSKTKTDMLNRTLSKMLADKVIHERVDRLQTVRYVALTAAGARLASEQVPALNGIVLKTRDNLRHANPHRTACNGVLAFYLRKYPQEAGHIVLSELEIASSRNSGRMRYWSRPDNKELVKVADGVVKILTDKQCNSYWLEIENSYRSPRDLMRLVAFCRQWYRDRFPFARLVFVITTNSAKNIGDRLSEAFHQAAAQDPELREHLPEILNRVQVIEFDALANKVQSADPS